MKKFLLPFFALAFFPLESHAQSTADLWANMTDTGNYFQATDGPNHAVKKSLGWQAFFNDLPVSPLVANAIFSAPTFFWVNQSNAIFKPIAGCAYIEAPRASAPAGNLNLYTTLAPSAPYKWTVPMMLNLTGSWDDAGIAIGNAASGRWTTISLKDGHLDIFHMSDATHWHDTGTDISYFGYMYPLIFQIENDGVNLHFRWSNDGYNFIQIYQEPLASWLGTGDRNAVYVDSDANDFPTGGTFCGMNYQ